MAQKFTEAIQATLAIGTMFLMMRSPVMTRLIFIRRRRRELETTDTELKAMAAEARIGLRRSPKNG